MNECKICKQQFSYAKQLHKCPEDMVSDAFKKAFNRESWIAECMRKQREGIR